MKKLLKWKQCVDKFFQPLVIVVYNFETMIAEIDNQ